MTINQRLKEFVDQNNIAPPDLYRKIGVSRMEYSGWISAGRPISVTKLQAILQLYPDLNARWFLLGEGSLQENTPMQTLDPLPVCDNCVSKQIQIELLTENTKTLNEYILVLKENINDLRHKL